MNIAEGNFFKLHAALWTLYLVDRTRSQSLLSQELCSPLSGEFPSEFGFLAGKVLLLIQNAKQLLRQSSFWDYTLNLDRKPPQPDYGFTLKSPSAGGRPNGPFCRESLPYPDDVETAGGEQIPIGKPARAALPIGA